MAEALASEAANIIGEKLISGPLNIASFVLGFKCDIEGVEKSKPRLEALLGDAEGKELSGVQKEVLKRVRCADQKIDDLLDERATRAKRRRILGGSRFTQKVAVFFSASLNPLVCRYRDYTQVQAIKELLNTLVGNPLGKTETRKRNPRRHVISHEVIGRERDRDKILGMFRRSAKPLSVVALVGIGGIGKTTLAQFVYNNKWVQTHFNVRLWVSVHEVFDLEEVIRKLLESAFPNESFQLYGIDKLQNCLKILLTQKKCLIVLDNVWDRKDLSSEWDSLKNLLSCDGVECDGVECHGAQRKVLITTRSETVAKMMGAVHPYMLGDLEAEDSWSLFQKVVFEEGSKPHLELIGREIADMCRNVPLIIKAIGSLLKEKDATVVEWRKFRDVLARRSCCDHDTSIMDILKLSYDQLDPRGLKLCFVLWSLFWKGFTISKRDLLYLWRALGYIEKYENQSVVDATEDYFFRLKSRGLFLKITDFEDEEDVEMHDVIHDLAISLAKSTYKMVESDECDFDEETRHVCFRGNVKFSSQDFPSSSLFKIKHQLQSLLVLRGDGAHSLKLKLERLSEFEQLRVFVLQYAGLEKMPRTIGKLMRLRYLDLSGNSFKELPDSITELVNLIYLNLSRCHVLQELPSNVSTLVDLETLDLGECGNLQELPRDISKLGKLRHLCLCWCMELKHMPSGLGKLTDLQTLDWYVEGGQSLNGDEVGGLADLNPLNNLEGTLTIVLDGCGLSESEARAANLQAKEKLTKLRILFKEGFDRDDEEVMLKGFQPPCNLRYLAISGYKGERLPSWIVDQRCLLNLEDIWIYDWKGCSFLGSFGRLPHLKFLTIVGCKNVEYIESDGDPTSDAKEANADHNPNANPSAPSAPPLFPSLELLRLVHLPKLKGWRRSRRSRSSNNDEYCLLGTAATAFPRLKKLGFYMVGLEVVPEEFRGLSSLETLEIEDCEQLKEIPEWMDTLTSLEKLIIEECRSLKSLPKQIANLTNLKRLSIEKCPGLAERCRKPTGEDWPLIQHVPDIDIN